MPGVTNESPQVPTLGSHRILLPTSQFCQLCLSQQIRWVHFKGHNFEGRIKFILNTCSIEQESEEIALASLFPEGCAPLVVKHSEETAELGNHDLPLDTLGGKHDTKR